MTSIWVVLSAEALVVFAIVAGMTSVLRHQVRVSAVSGGPAAGATALAGETAEG